MHALAPPLNILNSLWNGVTLQQYGFDDNVMNYLNNSNELQTHNISRSRVSRDTVRNNVGNKLHQLC